MKGIINGLYHFTGTIGFPSYALAIILMAIIVKVILYPLTVKQMKSTMGMQDIQPKMQEIQKKYKNNPEKMNQEVMALYQEYDINPMAGCLPLLIQLPILYGLFAAMRTFEYVNTADAGFFWIANISEADPLHILPVLVGLAMFLQQKFMMPASTGGNDQANQMMKMMLYVMPVMIGFMALTLPSGLAIYWAMFSILSMIQQIFINKRRKKEQEIRAQKEIERKAEMERKKEEQRKMGQAPSKKKKKKPEPKPKAEYIPPAKKEESGEK